MAGLNFDELKKEYKIKKSKKVQAEITEVLKLYFFNDAKELFSQNRTYLDKTWFENKLKEYEIKHSDEKSQKLKDQIYLLLKNYQFDEANSLFNQNVQLIDKTWFELNHAKFNSEYQLILEAEKEHERKELQKKQAIEVLKECIKSNFLSSDHTYKERYSEIVSEEHFSNMKTEFVRTWVKLNTNIELDSEQALTIASYGKNIQVIARAGSGKTTTLICRAVFLQKHCRVVASQILLLAFNREAAEEIKERLEKHLEGNCPYVMTFHALAYAIVHPEESLIYDDPTNNIYAKSSSLQSVIDHYLHEPEFKDKIRSLMLDYFRSDWEEIVAGGYNLEKDKLIEYRRSLQNISLRNEYLKSYGEKLIADFLFEHDIPYAYEKNYWWNRINYRPDFTVPLSAKGGLIIEYFGLIGDSDYDELTEEKRKYWQKNDSWKLLEIAPRNVSVGREQFFSFFKQLLDNNGVNCTHLSEDEIWNRIKGRAIDNFTKTATSFIQRCRKLSLTPVQLDNLIHSRNDLSSVEKQFLEITQYLYSSYIERLSATGEEDFEGLMQRAASQIRGGQSIFERKSGKGDLKDIRYMFIDEYQDFSDLFLKLVNSIRSQNSQIDFFCVGDDWQAINGFAGSDLQFYENFKDYFSPSRELYISTNYRSSKEIVALGNALMEGLGKPAEPHKKENGTIRLGNLEDFTPSIREKERHSGDQITPVVLRLVSELLATEKNVVLLSRANTLMWYVNYNAIQSHKKNGLDPYCELIRSYFPEELRCRISISTSHKYKGQESDAVIILDAVLRSYPLIHPNWIFTRLLGDDMDKITAEEKRLFYVAITRAVDTLIILTEKQEQSPFLKEITSRQQLQYINWDDFPPVKDKKSRLMIQVGNLNKCNAKATIDIRSQLRACGYQWNPIKKLWEQSFPDAGFSVDDHKKSIWSESANEVHVKIVDEHNVCFGEYSIHSGQWSKISSKKP